MTVNSPASNSLVLELQVLGTTPGYEVLEMALRVLHKHPASAQPPHRRGMKAVLGYNAVAGPV